jgi:hypothetical protein
MQKHLVAIFLLFSSLTLAAQGRVVAGRILRSINFNVGINGGACQLFHNTDFERNQKLQSLYKFVTFSHDPPESYTWEMFEEDYKMRKTFRQPRFGFTGDLSIKRLPLHVIAEWNSSTSTYESMSTALTFALGHDFSIGDNLGLTFSVLGGYKLVSDNGWGTATIVNSFKDSRVRNEAVEFFDPVNPLGTSKGRLFAFRTGFGKTVGLAENIKIGAEIYGELDATPKIERQSRMTNVGAQVFLRFNLLGNWSAFDDTFYPNTNGRN